MGLIATTLAQIASAAYSDTLQGLPAGFTPLADATLSNGVFKNQNAAAIAVTGVLDGRPSLVLAFRGSDDRQDYLNDLNNINVDYGKYASLITSVDAYAATSGLPVVVTGHSLGGAMAQLYLADHPLVSAPADFGVTFGSPGALLPTRQDDRLTNYYVADDIVPFAGLFRAEIGAKAASDPIYAGTVALDLSLLSGGALSTQDVLSSIPNLTTNYVNRGSAIFLPGMNGSAIPPSPSSLLNANDLVELSANAADHLIATYISKVASAPEPNSQPDPTHSTYFGVSTHDAYSLGGAVYALYDGLLGRAPDTLGLEFWADAFSDGVAPSALAAGFLSSPEGQARAGAVDNATFVTQLYDTTLHRAPDAAGLQFWTNDLNTGNTRANVGAAFALAPEHLANIQPALNAGLFVPDDDVAAVARIYYTVLGRAPDAAGLVFWSDAIKAGTPLSAETQSFIDTPEAQSKTAALTTAQYVDQVYSNALGRHAEADGLAFWTNAIDNHVASRVDVTTQIGQSAEAQIHLAPLIEQGWHLA